MRGLTRRWIGAEEAERAAGGPGSGLVERVLAARGLTDAGERERFLNPTLHMLHDPSGIPDLDAAAARVLGACRGGEKVVIYGDYDADGVTASAVLVRALRAIAPGADVSAYIPHRLDEGYGLNGDALRELAASGARVVVSVDCGVTAVAEARLAKNLGLELIITDHHNPPASMEDLPDAMVLHPRRPDSAYPFGELCGAGVAFKLAWRLATLSCGSERVPAALRETLLELLGLAALGTVADVVPLVDENRAIAAFGLRRLASSSIPGVRALVEASSVGRGGVDAEAAGFRLGPRLNAAGRLGHARDALELLLTDDAPRAAALAAELDALNTERRSIERRIADEAGAMAERAGMTGGGRRAIVLASEGWHAGVIGIVCSRLVERYGRPVVLLQREGGVCKGSCRSVEGFNIAGALGGCAEHLLTHGGHDMAAGLSLEEASLEAFREAFCAAADAALTEDDLSPGTRVDASASPEELTVDHARGLARLAPFGRSNPAPTLLVRGSRLAEDAGVMGAHGRHGQLRLERAGGAVRCVAWNWGERVETHARELRRGAEIDALVRLKLNEWRGRVSAECEVLDLRLAGAPEVAAPAGAGVSRPSSCPS